jgi:DNA-binding transcriptional MocR family regulator
MFSVDSASNDAEQLEGRAGPIFLPAGVTVQAALPGQFRQREANMLSLNVGAEDVRPPVEQIVTGIRREIDERHLRPGTRIPSIRSFAKQYRVSRFTVVEAYDRLVAMGYLRSRRGAGFYALAPQPITEPWPINGVARANEPLVWLTRQMSEAGPNAIFPGGGWLPPDWHDQAGIRQSLNVLARKNGGHLVDYGSPYGYLPLREHLCMLLGDIGINVQAPQILLTTAASQALDLLIRLLMKPGDTALVDDPGYYILFGILRLHGIQIIGVPRKSDGPDIKALERLATQHRPKIYFTQTAVQNPTGTTMAPHTVFRVLQVAECCNFTIVEDDVCSDLQRALTPRLATLDQLSRVIYVRSFTKTMSASMRVGFVASRPELIDHLADIKILTSITSSELAERLIYQMLIDGHYRKHLARLWARLDEAATMLFGHSSASASSYSRNPSTGSTFGHVFRVSRIRSPLPSWQVARALCSRRGAYSVRQSALALDAVQRRPQR